MGAALSAGFVTFVLVLIMGFIFTHQPGSERISEHPKTVAIISIYLAFCMGGMAYSEHLSSTGACVEWMETTTNKRLCKTGAKGEAVCEQMVEKTCIKREQ